MCVCLYFVVRRSFCLSDLADVSFHTYRIRIVLYPCRIDAAEEAINELHEQRVVLARDTTGKWEYPAIEPTEFT